MSDICVVGGGIVGGMIARTLATKYPTKQILLLEKESKLGLHTSTRNSAVLHAGFYYFTDSIKAKLCKEGNRSLTQYCIDNHIKIKHTGKFLVARNQQENERLYEIKKQGDVNQVELEIMNAEQALKIEKYVKVHNPNFNFLFSPTTKVADNKGIMNQIQIDLQGMSNVNTLFDTQFVKLIEQQENLNRFQVVRQGQERQLETKYLINAAGLYADIIAKQFGFGKQYEIWPFKGKYLVTNIESKLPQSNALIYPVPPLKGNFFLGIHTTLNIDDQLKIGPSISPALWREQYSLNENFRLEEFLEIMKLNIVNTFSQDMNLYAKSLYEELKKINKKYMLKEAMRLTTQLDGFEMNELLRFFDKGKPGIRSQLYDKKEKKMVQDFIFEHDKNSLHLLNVASPGWTCSIPMADHISDIIKQYI